MNEFEFCYKCLVGMNQTQRCKKRSAGLNIDLNIDTGSAAAGSLNFKYYYHW